eukprot:1792929-Pyramimonas_sp.AAC.1
MTAPTLTTPADKDDHVLASAMEVLEGARHACTADAREWPARNYSTRIVPPKHARKGVQMSSTCGPKGRIGRIGWQC